MSGGWGCEYLIGWVGQGRTRSFLWGALSDKSDGSDKPFFNPEKGCSALPCSAGGSVESDIFGSFAVREAVENIDYLENKFWALA